MKLNPVHNIRDVISYIKESFMDSGWANVI